MTNYINKYLETAENIQIPFLAYYNSWMEHVDKSKPIRPFYGGYLSQWHKAPFSYKYTEYLTAEHYMMASKARIFGDTKSLNKILLEPSPKEVKRLGRKITPFDENIWNNHKVKVVVMGNLLKFSQNSELKEKLLKTGKKILVEASPYDTIWGVGLSMKDAKVRNIDEWQGLNLLGFCLMEVRNVLRKNY